MRITLIPILLVIATRAIAADPLLLWNTTGDRASFNEMRSALEEAGGHAQHAYIPYFLAGRIAPEHLLSLPSTVDVIILHGDRSALAALPDDAQNFAEAWARAMLKLTLTRVIPENTPPLADDVIMLNELSRKDRIPSGDRNIPYGAHETDTSSYMIGDVSVSLIFMESNETVCLDPPTCAVWGSDSEDWSEVEIIEVICENILAVDWWAMRDPIAHLLFVHEYHLYTPTEYEPITLSGHEQRDYWIYDAMQFLGYNPEQNPAHVLVWDYLNDKRSENNTHWGFVEFIVDSSNDADGKFADGFFAFAMGSAYGGGPYLVMTYDNAGYSIDNMDAVAAHEIGHMFAALDQYHSTCLCTTHGGYLWIENQNCVNDCASDVASIMRGATIPFAAGAVDDYARGQIGWRDSDSDGIHDVEDMNPNVWVDLPALRNQPSFDVYGTATVNPMEPPNPWYNASSINTIAGIQFRIEDSSWINGMATDGGFDGPEEDFVLEVTVPGSGVYNLECRAVNKVGNFTDPVFSGVFEVEDLTAVEPLSYVFRLYRNVPNPFNPTTTIRYSLAEAAVVNLIICDISGRVVQSLISCQVIAAGTYSITWDGQDDSGQLLGSGVYFYRLEAGEYVETRKMTLLK